MALVFGNIKSYLLTAVTYFEVVLLLLTPLFITAPHCFRGLYAWSFLFCSNCAFYSFVIIMMRKGKLINKLSS